MTRPFPQLVAVALLGLVVLVGSVAAQNTLTTERVINGLARPVQVASTPSQPDLIYVVEQHQGDIHVFDLDGNQLGTLLDLTGTITTGSERGLLGMAFDPDFATNGFFYVNYTGSGGATFVVKYRTPSPLGPANTATATTIFTINQPSSNHNAGCLQFGPDGYLYIGLGDGGGSGDSSCNAQKSTTMLGKMLRVDGNGNAPASNPYVGVSGIDDRIWAFGLRNPWRYSFDRLTGDLYIADVGQNAVEEINFVTAGSVGGENYGWKVKEGNNCFSTSNCPSGTPTCSSSVFTTPVRTYGHGGGRCSVTGGVVYRGCAIPWLQGTYFYADYCSDEIWSFEITGSHLLNHTDRTSELDPAGSQSILSPSSFNEDAAGEIYICDLTGGEVFRIIADSPTPSSDLGGGGLSSTGDAPTLSTCGLLTSGNSCEIRLNDAPASSLSLLFVSVNQASVPAFGGTFNLGAPLLPVVLATDGSGAWVINAPGGLGSFSAFAQSLTADPTNPNNTGAAMSNGLKLDFQP